MREIVKWLLEYLGEGPETRTDLHTKEPTLTEACYVESIVRD
jgi:hypothetical protein